MDNGVSNTVTQARVNIAIKYSFKQMDCFSFKSSGFQIIVAPHLLKKDLQWNVIVMNKILDLLTKVAASMAAA